jgi:hypothetical protein
MKTTARIIRNIGSSPRCANPSITFVDADVRCFAAALVVSGVRLVQTKKTAIGFTRWQATLVAREKIQAPFHRDQRYLNPCVKWAL